MMLSVCLSLGHARVEVLNNGKKIGLLLLIRRIKHAKESHNKKIWRKPMDRCKH